MVFVDVAAAAESDFAADAALLLLLIGTGTRTMLPSVLDCKHIQKKSVKFKFMD
jgi:hypothetical protein